MLAKLNWKSLQFCYFQISLKKCTHTCAREMLTNGNQLSSSDLKCKKKNWKSCKYKSILLRGDYVHVLDSVSQALWQFNYKSLPIQNFTFFLHSVDILCRRLQWKSVYFYTLYYKYILYTQVMRIVQMVW